MNNKKNSRLIELSLNFKLEFKEYSCYISCFCFFLMIANIFTAIYRMLQNIA